MFTITSKTVTRFEGEFHDDETAWPANSTGRAWHYVR